MTRILLQTTSNRWCGRLVRKNKACALSSLAGESPAPQRRQILIFQQPLTALLVVFVILLTDSLLAHDMYIRPRFENEKQVSLAMFVEKNEVVWFESMTAGLRMDGPSGEANLSIPDEGDPLVEFDQHGTFVIGWESEPLFIQVEPDIFKKYIALEAYAAAADLLRQSREKNKPGREIYTRFIKSFIQIGTKLTIDFNRPFGYKIEIIPLQNPCGLEVDSELDVQVLYQGKPLANHRIMATYDSYSTLPEDYAQVTRTDANGIAKFRITQKGFWLIRSNEMLPLEDNDTADWQSFWANLTFEVK